MMWGGWSAWLVMALMMAVMLAAILLGLWIVARPFSRRAESKHRPDRALDELRQRYARGEIDADQYEERRRRLSSAH